MVLHAITLALCTLIYTICIHVFYCVRIGIIKIRRQNYLLYYLQYITLITTITTASSPLCSCQYYYPSPLFFLFAICSAIHSLLHIIIHIYYIHIIFTLYTPPSNHRPYTHLPVYISFTLLHPFVLRTIRILPRFNSPHIHHLSC